MITFFCEMSKVWPLSEIRVFYSILFSLTGGVLELGKGEVGDGVRRLEVNASLSGGCGENAWQHAQLCRQQDNAVNQFPFCISISFED